MRYLQENYNTCRSPYVKCQFLETDFNIRSISLLYGIQQPTVVYRTKSPFGSEVNVVKINGA